MALLDFVHGAAGLRAAQYGLRFEQLNTESAHGGQLMADNVFVQLMALLDFEQFNMD